MGTEETHENTGLEPLLDDEQESDEAPLVEEEDTAEPPEAGQDGDETPRVTPPNITSSKWISRS